MILIDPFFCHICIFIEVEYVLSFCHVRLALEMTTYLTRLSPKEATSFKRHWIRMPLAYRGSIHLVVQTLYICTQNKIEIWWLLKKMGKICRKLPIALTIRIHVALKRFTLALLQSWLWLCLICWQNAYELYGADFMLTEDLRPWLLEINSSPSMARTTHATSVLVDKVLEDLIKGIAIVT